MVGNGKKSARNQRSTAGRLVPWLLFAVLSAATVFVWWQQVNHHRSQLIWHTKDVAFQASRRLEIFVESRLVVAKIFSERWSTHERRDFSKKRFAEFASVLLSEVPGFQSVWLVRSDLRGGWRAPPDGRSVLQTSTLQQWPAFAEARRSRSIVLSAPISAGGSVVRFFAVLPLNRQSEFLGFLVVEFDAEALFKFCFHEKIRSEFAFKIEDGGRLLYRHSPDGRAIRFADAPIRTSRRFNVRNRTWRMSVKPRDRDLVTYTSSKHLTILLLGLLLSLLVSGLFALLNRRTWEQRVAREQADDAIQEREEVQSALVGSEARYRSVFNSASDGLLVVDHSGLVVDANQAACTITGRDPEVLVGSKADALIDSDQRSHYEAFSQRLARGSAARIELSGVTLAGVALDLEIKGSVFSYGDTSRVLLIISDVTERKKAERRLATLSRKVLLAQEDERRRVARDLHDELGQIIASLRLELDLVRKRLPIPPQTASETFQEPIQLLEKATAELRRICDGLRPPLLDDLGVGPAVERLLEKFARRTEIKVSSDLQIADETHVPAEIALSAYRVLQEAMTNVVRHSAATELTVSLIIDSKRLLLSIYDNGVGFERRKLDTSGGSGIAGMEERASLVGGQYQVQSVEGEGTRVMLEVPLPRSTPGGGT